MTTDPHGKQPVLASGHPLAGAARAMILLHGRGGSAEDILSLAAEFDLPDVAYLAPQAAGHTWYPYPFLTPIEQNEPWLTSALTKVSRMVEDVVRAGIPREKIVIGGFSQGACLTSTFGAKYPARYGGLIAFTGGLIGPPGTDFNYVGSLAGTPAFLGSGDPDAHVPWSRVQETASVLTGLGAQVVLKRYPGMAHTVSREEIAEAKRLVG
jgi:predicted esterase